MQMVSFIYAQKLYTSATAGGTGRNAYIDGYRVGGKTGTAQKVGENSGYMQGNYILSFLGAAPMNDPKAVVYLLSITLRIPSNMGVWLPHQW